MADAFKILAGLAKLAIMGAAQAVKKEPGAPGADARWIASDGIGDMIEGFTGKRPTQEQIEQGLADLMKPKPTGPYSEPKRPADGLIRDHLFVPDDQHPGRADCCTVMSCGRPRSAHADAVDPGPAS